MERETKKLDALKEIEANFKTKIQNEVSGKEKQLITFPYPYMNGLLHLGHLFTLSKADFVGRFEFLRNKNVLFPIAFHCTGMPIAASAQKLREGDESVVDILRQMKIENIDSFKDPQQWIRTFPELTMKTIKNFNAAVDWRRSFVTTPVNEFYDSFVAWQFRKLKEKNLLCFGKRYSIFCPKNNQPCLDHDRSTGEGVNPAVFQLMKFKMNEVTLCLPIKATGFPVFAEIPKLTKFRKLELNTEIMVVPEFVYKNMKFQFDLKDLGDAKIEKTAKIMFQDKLIELREANKDEIFVKIDTKVEIKDPALFFSFYAPETTVESRAGVECVVALLDQWFINYNDKNWKTKVFECLDEMKITDSNTASGLREAVDWIDKWAFSRTFGLGTAVPWDKQYIIDSLSDSTIYMSFYCYNHILFNDIYGEDANLHPEDLCDCVWDFIYEDLLVDIPKSHCENENCVVRNKTKALILLEECRKSLNYFYPVDLRVSGKDLIKNHLIFYIFNHVALFKKKAWPLRIEANGHVLLNSEKMSKSTGNFMTGDESLEKYGESATRMALALCGDGLTDANFMEDSANAIILKIFTFVENVKNYVASSDLITSIGFAENYLQEIIDSNTSFCVNAYEAAKFADVVKFGFYEMLNEYETYLIIGGQNNHIIVLDFFKRIILLMYPIIPSISEYLSGLVKMNLVLSGETIKTYNFDCINKMKYIKRCIKLIQQKIKRKRSNIVVVKVSLEYQEWQNECLLKKLDNLSVIQIFEKFAIDKNIGMKFCANHRQDIVRIDEIDAWNKLKWYAERIIGVNINVITCDSTYPMNPIIEFED